MRAVTSAAAGAGILAASATAVQAADWPHWRGPQRNGISVETAWTHQFGPSGPRRVWSAQVGQGFSAPSIAGGRVYTLGNDGSRDVVWCLNASTGREIWRFAYPQSPGDYGGPRATPTVESGRVYTLSRDGLAHCLDAATGKQVWRADLRAATRSQPPRWGFAGSPLILGGLALYNVGSAGIALNKSSGKVVWASGPQTAGYATPTPFQIGAQRGVAFFVAWGVVAVNPASGKPLWQHPWNTQFDVNAADPLFIGDSVFLSSNYGRGCALIRVGAGRPRVVWENRNMRNHVNTSVLLGGYLYGNDENTLRCIDARTGDEKWGARGLGKGGLIAAAGKLIALTERGELWIVEANPARFTELTRVSIGRGTFWTHPVLANGYLYCRSHEGELICVDLRAKT